MTLVSAFMCSIFHYGNINKDTTYLSYMYCTVLYYLHYTHYSIYCYSSYCTGHLAPPIASWVWPCH